MYIDQTFVFKADIQSVSPKPFVLKVIKLPRQHVPQLRQKLTLFIHLLFKT